MVNRADFPTKQAFLDKLTETLSQGTQAPAVRELMLMVPPEWSKDALELFNNRKSIEEAIGSVPISTTGTSLLTMAFGWTKYLTPVLLSPRLQGSVIGVILTAILTFFTMPRTQVSENSAQFLTKNVGDKLAEEMRQRLIKEIDALAKSDEFKKAVAKAIEDTKAANEKK